MHRKGSYKSYKNIAYSVQKTTPLLRREFRTHLLLSNLLVIIEVHLADMWYYVYLDYGQ